MRRVHRLSWMLLAVVCSQVPSSAPARRVSSPWEPFLRSACAWRLPTTYIERVSETTGMSFGDPGGAIARYRGGSVCLQTEFRDPESGGLLPMERLWRTPSGVGSVYHELFHAWFEQVVCPNADELAEFERQAQRLFVDVPQEKRLEVAEEAVACWIGALIDSAVSVLARNAEAATGRWKPVAQWDAKDRRMLANLYEVNFRPRTQALGYYQDGGEVVNTRVTLDEWFIEWAWRNVIQKEMPRSFEDFLARLP